MTHKKFERKVGKDDYNLFYLNKASSHQKGWNLYKKSFSKLCNELFDVRTSDKQHQKSQEKLWGVKETNLDVEFYYGQCKIPQVSQHLFK